MLCSWAKSSYVGINPPKINGWPGLSPRIAQIKKMCRGLRPVCASGRRNRLVHNFLSDPSCTRAVTGADKPRAFPICSFSPETGPNMASFFTVLHLATVCILNPSIFMQRNLVNTGSAGPMITHQKWQISPPPHCWSTSKNVGSVDYLRDSPGVFLFESMKCAQHVQKMLLDSSFWKRNCSFCYGGKLLSME